MIINSKIKNTSDAIDYLNRAVFGEDPETSILTRVYEGATPIQDRVTAVENSAALVDVQALKDKVDELSDLTEIFANLAYPMPNLVSNGDFSNGTTGWTSYGSTSTVSNDNLFNTSNGTQLYGVIYQDVLPLVDTIYIFAKIRVSNNSANQLIIRSSNASIQAVQSNPVNGQWYFLSAIGVSTINRFESRHTYADTATANGKIMEVDFCGTYNVSQMKLNGVKDDNGTPFTLLTNAQIKTQLDLWVQTRFPLDVLLMMRS